MLGIFYGFNICSVLGGFAVLFMRFLFQELIRYCFVTQWLLACLWFKSSKAVIDWILLYSTKTGKV